MSVIEQECPPADSDADVLVIQLNAIVLHEFCDVVWTS